jgi:hypothetical protein
VFGFDFDRLGWGWVSGHDCLCVCCGQKLRKQVVRVLSSCCVSEARNKKREREGYMLCVCVCVCVCVCEKERGAVRLWRVRHV